MGGHGVDLHLDQCRRHQRGDKDIDGAGGHSHSENDAHGSGKHEQKNETTASSMNQGNRQTEPETGDVENADDNSGGRTDHIDLEDAGSGGPQDLDDPFHEEAAFPYTRRPVKERRRSTQHKGRMPRRRNSTRRCPR